jgi:hypothetical protein
MSIARRKSRFEKKAKRSIMAMAMESLFPQTSDPLLLDKRMD